jgi:predicted transcriptional regulator
MKKVKSCGFLKGVVVDENKNIVEVSKLIRKFQERRIYVLNKKKNPVGIISIVDVNDRVVAENLDLKKTKAKDIMSYPLKLVVDVNEDVKAVASKMIELDIYYAPVVEKGIFIGVITYASLLNYFKK